MKLKLKTRFIILAMASVAGSIVSHLTTTLSDKHNSELAARQELATLVEQHQIEGGLKLSTLWGDTMSVLVAAKTNDLATRKEKEKAFRDDYEILAKDLNENKAADVPEDIKQQLGKTQISLKAYGEVAQEILIGADNFDAATLLIPKLHKLYAALQDDQSKASDMILMWGAGVKKTATETGANSSYILMFLDIFSVVIALSVVTFAIRRIFRPLHQMMESMQQIAAGDTDTVIPHTERNDEMGDMARTVQVFKENAQRVVHMAEEQKNQQAVAEQQKSQAMKDLANSFETNVKNVVDMVASAATEMDSTARSVAKITEANQGKLNHLTDQIAGATRNVKTVSTGTTQLSTATAEINKQVTRAAAITATAVIEAQKADGTVQGLSDAAQKIGEVVEMINSIAAQINLLALNATIEAARAGDAGKGFAVVASEVKNLAAQTTKATEQIAQYISSIQGATNETVGVIKNIGGTINEINEISTTIAAAVEQQGITTKDIANNVQQAAQGTEEVSRHAAEVSSSSKQTGESANQMLAATNELSRQSETLRHEVDKFLAGVREG